MKARGLALGLAHELERFDCVLAPGGCNRACLTVGLAPARLPQSRGCVALRARCALERLKGEPANLSRAVPLERHARVEL